MESDQTYKRVKIEAWLCVHTGPGTDSVAIVCDIPAVWHFFAVGQLRGSNVRLVLPWMCNVIYTYAIPWNSHFFAFSKL